MDLSGEIRLISDRTFPDLGRGMSAIISRYDVFIPMAPTRAASAVEPGRWPVVSAWPSARAPADPATGLLHQRCRSGACW